MGRKYQENSLLVTSFVRNTGFNLLSQGIFVILGFWAIPILLHKLGGEKFGLFSLVLAVIGYFSLLDFGISRANTKFLSESLIKGEKNEIYKIVWTSLSITFLIGIVLSIIVVLLSPFFVDNILKTDSPLRTEGILYFKIAGVCTPFMLVFGTLKGFQIALQRFDIVNIFQTLTGIIQWCGSIVLLWWGFDLEAIILLTVGSRVVLTAVAFFILPRFIPGIFQSVIFLDRDILKKLWSFGIWVTVSQLISPLFLYIDRVFIGFFLSLTAVTYYSVPQEAVTRMLILAISLSTTLFPVMSGQSALSQSESKIGDLYFRSIKYLFAILMPLVFSFLLFAPELLEIWLGEEYVVHSIATFQILLIGLFFVSLAQIPTTLLHAFGRPDITAKFHIIEFPIVVLLNLLLIPWIGILGAAITWTLRVIIDAILLFLAAQKQMIRFSGTYSWEKIDKGFSFQLILVVIMGASIFLINSVIGKILTMAIVFGLSATVTWFYSFDELDRKFILRMIPS